MNNDWIIWNGGECPVPGMRGRSCGRSRRQKSE